MLGGRGTRNHIIGTPVIYDGRVYVGVGEDPEHGEGVGHLVVHRSRRSAATSARSWPSTSRTRPSRFRINADAGRGRGGRRNRHRQSEFGRRLALRAATIRTATARSSSKRRCTASIGTVAIKDDMLFMADFSGLFHCWMPRPASPIGRYDMLAAAWGSPLIVDGKVYIGDEDGDIAVFKLARKRWI